MYNIYFQLSLCIYTNIYAYIYQYNAQMPLSVIRSHSVLEEHNRAASSTYPDACCHKPVSQPETPSAVARNQMIITLAPCLPTAPMSRRVVP